MMLLSYDVEKMENYTSQLLLHNKHLENLDGIEQRAFICHASSAKWLT